MSPSELQCTYGCASQAHIIVSVLALAIGLFAILFPIKKRGKR